MTGNLDLFQGMSEAEIVWDEYVWLLNMADQGGPPVTQEMHNDFTLRIWRSTRMPLKGKQTPQGRLEAEQFRKQFEFLKLEGDKDVKA